MIASHIVTLYGSYCYAVQDVVPQGLVFKGFLPVIFVFVYLRQTAAGSLIKAEEERQAKEKVAKAKWSEVWSINLYRLFVVLSTVTVSIVPSVYTRTTDRYPRGTHEEAARLPAHLKATSAAPIRLIIRLNWPHAKHIYKIYTSAPHRRIDSNQLLMQPALPWRTRRTCW